MVSVVWGLAHALAQQAAGVRVVALHLPGAATQEMLDDVEVFRPRYCWPERGESLRRGGGGLPVTLRDYPMARAIVGFSGRLQPGSGPGCS